MSDLDDEKKVAAVQKVLGEPVFCELSQSAWKIRTNLIVTSVISISIVFAGLHIDSESTFLGLKFKGLNDIIITRALFWITLYLLIHFLWSAWDNFVEWRLRITGTKVAFITAGVYVSEHGDYPSDPRQSTLYHWWKSQAQKIDELVNRVKEIDNQLNGFEARLKSEPNTNSEQLIITDIKSVQVAVVNLDAHMKQVNELLLLNRVPASLERFDNWFQLFLRSQNLRWLIVECGTPLIVGSLALILLWNR